MSDKPRGRPPLVEGEVTVPVTVRVPARDFDRACQAADQQQVSVPEAIRRALKRGLEPESKSF